MAGIGAVGRALLLADLVDQAKLEHLAEQVQRPRLLHVGVEVGRRPGDHRKALVGAALMGLANEGAGGEGGQPGCRARELA